MAEEKSQISCKGSGCCTSSGGASSEVCKAEGRCHRRGRARAESGEQDEPEVQQRTGTALEGKAGGVPRAQYRYETMLVGGLEDQSEL